MKRQLPSFIKDHLYLQLDIPVRCQPLAESIKSHCSWQKNLDTFQLIEVLEEHHTTQTEGIDKRYDELIRLEQKMDLILTLLGQLLEQQTQPPPFRTSIVGLNGLCWQDNSALNTETPVRIELFVNKRTNPLCFNGRFISVIQENDMQWCCVKFESMHQQEQDLFEKWIFRQHRRAIAQRKHQS